MSGNLTFRKRALRKKVDYIIIGQGLAGSSVAMHLLEMGKKIMVFDDPYPNSASKIAAGLFNPITGKNMVKTWLADETFSYLHEYYTTVETATNTKFYFPKGIFHPFSSIKEQNEWMARSSEVSIKRYIKSINTTPQLKGVKNPYGGVFINEGGYVDTHLYLASVRNYLLGLNSFTETCLNEGEIEYHDTVLYGDWEAKKVIFCAGDRASMSKWFNWVPIIPLKGETISIKAEHVENQVINKGVYIVPKGNHVYHVGATYQLGDLTQQTTPKGKLDLIEKLKMILDCEFEIIDHTWGMRPTTHDRRPVLGAHPKYSNLICFNGLGTKGISLSPYFGRELIHMLENKGALTKEVDISRYKLLN